jgi:hypothetical protein
MGPGLIEFSRASGRETGLKRLIPVAIFSLVAMFPIASADAQLSHKKPKPVKKACELTYDIVSTTLIKGEVALSDRDVGRIVKAFDKKGIPKTLKRLARGLGSGPQTEAGDLIRACSDLGHTPPITLVPQG